MKSKPQGPKIYSRIIIYNHRQLLTYFSNIYSFLGMIEENGIFQTICPVKTGIKLKLKQFR